MNIKTTCLLLLALIAPCNLFPCQTTKDIEINQAEKAFEKTQKFYKKAAIFYINTKDGGKNTDAAIYKLKVASAELAFRASRIKDSRMAAICNDMKDGFFSSDKAQFDEALDNLYNAFKPYAKNKSLTL